MTAGFHDTNDDGWVQLLGDVLEVDDDEHAPDFSDARREIAAIKAELAQIRWALEVMGDVNAAVLRVIKDGA